MSILDPAIESSVPADAAAARSEPSLLGRFLAAQVSSDHKTIAKLLGADAIAGIVIAALLGALAGLERIDGDGALLPERLLPEIFNGYRLGLVLGGVIPLLLAICVYVVPLQLGARSLAFPRAASLGAWTWLFGIVLIVIALFNNGGPHGSNDDLSILYVGGVGLVAIGLTLIAATVATSVLTTRAPGMRLSRVPLFSWSALVGSLAVALTMPILLGVTIYLYFDVRYASAEVSLFGGAAAFGDWTGWLLTVPSAALIAAPALGVLAELVPLTFRRRLPMRFVALTGLGVAGLALLAAVTQRFDTVLPGTGPGVSAGNIGTKVGFLLQWLIFSIGPALGVVAIVGLIALCAKPPSADAKRAGATTSFRFLPALPFALVGALLIAVGSLGAAVGGIEDLGLLGTVFAEGATMAHIYGCVLAAIGAIVHWAPKIVGSKLADGPVLGLGALASLGAVLASAPYLIAGFLDQPAESPTWTNDGPGELLNFAVTVGHALMALVVLGVVGLLLKAAGDDNTAGDDPWDGHTLEWATTSPPPANNFATVPIVRSPEPLLDLKTANAGGDDSSDTDGASS